MEGENIITQRGKRIIEQIKEPVDVLFVYNPGEPLVDDNFFYLTGVEYGLFEGCMVLAHPDGNRELIVSALEAESAAQASAPLHVYHTTQEKDELLKKLVGKHSRVGINFQRMTHHDLLHFKKVCTPSAVVDSAQAFQQCRMVKDADERGRITQACRIADQVASRIPSLVTDSMKEYELAAEIDYLMQKQGAQQPAFTTISSFGTNTAQPHYTHGDSVLQHGAFVLCDFGAQYKRYNSDITRTFVCTNPTKEQQDMHATVLDAQHHALDLIQPGVKAAEIHQAVADFIDTTPWKGRFIHSLGHSLGLAVHDGPGFTASSPTVLEENMVLTVEPGVYVPGIGGVRIEDDILVTKDGCQQLTTTTRDLLVV